MTEISKLIEEHRSFKRFSESLKAGEVTTELLQDWYGQICAMEHPTIVQERFIRCFYRKYHKALGVKLQEAITDKRYQHSAILYEEVFFEVLKAMNDAGITTGSAEQLAASLKQHYGLPQEVETIRQRLAGAGVYTDELRPMLQRMKKWTGMGKKSSP